MDHTLYISLSKMQGEFEAKFSSENTMVLAKGVLKALKNVDITKKRFKYIIYCYI